MKIHTCPMIMLSNEEYTSAITTLNTGNALIQEIKKKFPKNDISTIYIEGRSLEEIRNALAILDFLRYDEADVYVEGEQTGDILTL